MHANIVEAQKIFQGYMQHWAMAQKYRLHFSKCILPFHIAAERNANDDVCL